jgi:hypothetical protein|tara:strand:- start:1128 stop:1370 length:243 start_codon:yes stop_codon:yes gene_type:complete
MSKEDIQFLEDRLSMMETEGWRDLIEDFKNLENSAGNIDTMNSEQDLWHAKGQLLIINLILSLQSATNLALEESVDQTPT